MKILVISNLYPPHYIGGYELGCKDVVEALKGRGHQVKVLTSTYGVSKAESDGEVYRWLEPQMHWKHQPVVNLVKLIRKEVINQSALRRLFTPYQPDVVYIWNLVLVSVSLAFLAQGSGAALCYFVSDNWLAQWENDSWYRLWADESCNWVRRLGRTALHPFLRPLGIIPSGSLELRSVQFVSEYLKRAAMDAGKPAANAEVIHWGIDVDRFPYKNAVDSPKRLLYVGQIMPHKGVHTAIEATRLLVRECGYPAVELTVVGGSARPDYLQKMQALVRSHGLENSVCFAGFVAREWLPQVYRGHDILLFPSVWDEPFSITVLEAMASGLAVVGTATGGGPEIMEHEINALIFPKEDPAACANQVQRLLEDRPLFDRLRENGRRTVEDRFTLGPMVELIEHSLTKAVRRERSKS